MTARVYNKLLITSAQLLLVISTISGLPERIEYYQVRKDLLIDNLVSVLWPDWMTYGGKKKGEGWKGFGTLEQINAAG